MTRVHPKTTVDPTGPVGQTWTPVPLNQKPTKPLYYVPPIDAMRFKTGNYNLGDQILAGKVHSGQQTARMATERRTPRLFDDIRADVHRLLPIPIDGIAVQKKGRHHIGVIDSGGTPVIFVLSAEAGIRVKEAPDLQKTWELYNSFLDAEAGATTDNERRHNAAAPDVLKSPVNLPPMVELFIQIDADLVKAGVAGARKPEYGHTAYDAVRNGKNVHVNAKGVKPVEWAPEKPAAPPPSSKPAPVSNKPQPISLVENGHEQFDHDDDVSPDAFNFVAKKKPKHTHALRDALSEYVALNWEGPPEHLAKIEDTLYTHFHNKGVVTQEEPDEDEEKETWSSRKTTAAPPMPSAFKAEGTKLIVGGKQLKVHPDVEQALYAWAKRFVYGKANAKATKKLSVDEVVKNITTIENKYRKNFEKSVRVLAESRGTPIFSGEWNYKNFVTRIEADMAKPKEKKPKPPEVTPKTHPWLFITQDNEQVRVLSPKFNTGHMYVSEQPSTMGTWVPPCREEDLIMNVPYGSEPKGWKGKVDPSPSDDYYIKWKGAFANGYVYLSRANADKRKQYRCSQLPVDDIRDQYTKDLDSTGADPTTKACALSTWLMDMHCIRNGGDGNAKKDKPTFGVSSLLVKHVKIDGTMVHFDFIAKHQERWKRSVDMSKAPKALAFLKKCMAGKGGDAKLWAGDGWSVTDANINHYMSQFERDGLKFTAKDFRTYHANHHMKNYLNKLEAAVGDYKLTDEECRAAFEGGRGADKVLNRTVRGEKLRDRLGLVTYEEHGKPAAQQGILPSVAQKLGHTTGSCRKSYLDGRMVVAWAVTHGWDARTGDEKKFREDMEDITKPLASDTEDD